VVEVLIYKNPTCGVEAELGIQIATETVSGLYNVGKIELHNRPHYIPKSADIARITIPVHSLPKAPGLDILEEKNCTTGHIVLVKVLQVLPQITIPVQSYS